MKTPQNNSSLFTSQGSNPMLTEMAVNDPFFLAFNESPMPMAILLPDVQNPIVTGANKAFLSAAGCKQQDITGIGIIDFFLRQHHKAAEGIRLLSQSLQKVINTQLTDVMPVLKYFSESPGKRQRRYYQCRNIPCTGTNGQIQYILFSATDVTERYTANRELKKMWQRLVSGQKIAKVGYWEADLIRNKVFWSDEVYTILGVKKDEVIAGVDMYLNAIHPVDRAMYFENRQLALSGKKEMDIELRIHQPDGTTKWVRQVGKVEKNSDGKVAAFEGVIMDITDAKKLKLSLEESNTRYSHISKATFDSVYDWDIVAEKFIWRENYHENFGYDAEAMSDSKWWSTHVHPEDIERILDINTTALKSGETHTINEYRFQKNDGTYAHVVDRSFIIRDENGRPIRMVGAIRDITSSKKLQELLHKTNQLAKIGSWEIDRVNQTVFWSDITKEIYEVPSDFQPSIGAIQAFFKNEEILTAINERIQLAIKNGIPWQEDYQILTHQGNIKWVRNIGEPMIENGLCKKIHGSIQDINDQKKSELEITESEKRYSELFRLNPHPIWIFKEDSYRFVKVNKATLDLYGYSEEEFLELTVLQMRPPEEIPVLLNTLKKNKKGEGFISGRFKHKTKTGKIITVDVVSVLMDFNNAKCRLAIMTDITERLRYEQKIARAVIKTQENERYEIGSELHDNVCQILASTYVRMNLLDSSVEEASQPLFRECKAFIDLATREIRDLSHRLAPASINDASLIETIEGLINISNFEKKYRFNFSFDKKLTTAKLSKELQLNLYRILQEQLNNIIKHAHCKRIEVKLLKIKQHIIMHIIDDGIGFDLKKVKTGIGLSNIKRRTELFDGKFEINTSPANGCELRIEIPLK
ncbi:MAG TPA: PAS domain-containing protein [Agriterribacter sp.]|nr:PAS domain-containing protein [Agriterribacter sp.]